MSRFWVVIPAAGVGARMGADRPKQYLPLCGKTVIEHTLACFTHHPAIAGIVLALSAEDPYWPALQIDTNVPLHTATGGRERCHSVLHALHLLSQHAAADDWVLVHDAARPCLTRSDIDKLLASLCEDEVGGILAVPVRDTMKQADEAGRIQKTVERDQLWHALTPQMFRLGLLTKALTQSLADGFAATDEASAMEHLAYHPRLVAGRSDNIKITQAEDLALAEFFLQS